MMKRRTKKQRQVLFDKTEKYIEDGMSQKEAAEKAGWQPSDYYWFKNKYVTKTPYARKAVASKRSLGNTIEVPYNGVMLTISSSSPEALGKVVKKILAED